MRGYINKSFSTIFASESINYIDLEDMRENNDEELENFYEGDEVEVLRVIEDESFNSGIAYVILNLENNASTTVDPMWISLYKYK